MSITECSIVHFIMGSRMNYLLSSHFVKVDFGKSRLSHEVDFYKNTIGTLFDYKNN